MATVALFFHSCSCATYYNNPFLRTLGFVLLMGGAAVANTDQAQTDKQEYSSESDQAYNDMATFVNGTEANVDAVGNEMQADYD